jgi:hypothetical protein
LCPVHLKEKAFSINKDLVLKLTSKIKEFADKFSITEKQKTLVGEFTPVRPITFIKSSSTLLGILSERTSTSPSFCLSPGTKIVNTFSNETSGLKNKLIDIQGLGWVEAKSFRSIG